MSFTDLQDRAKHVWGVFRIDFDSEDSIPFTARVASWPFVQGTGRGRTLDEASARAVRQFDRRMQESHKYRATDEDMASI